MYRGILESFCDISKIINAFPKKLYYNIKIYKADLN